MSVDGMQAAWGEAAGPLGGQPGGVRNLPLITPLGPAGGAARLLRGPRTSAPTPYANTGP